MIGDGKEEDATCDLHYMMGAMYRVGAAMRKAFHWIAPEHKCYLVIDNTGGHGMKIAIIDYVAFIINKYNIVVIFQIP